MDHGQKLRYSLASRHHFEVTVSTFYVTTPIYYVNDKPHIGHAYTTIAADVLARWHRLQGHDVHFLTGTDEHGQKVLKAATSRGVTPTAHVDELVQRFEQLWTRLNISNDDFIRTTETRHTKIVQATLQKLYDNGDIYADDYEGWYSTSAERFWTEKDLVDGKCPDTGQEVEWIKERNYFFRMSKYADQLRKWIADHPDFLQPENRKNEVLGYLRKEVGDLCISRPSTRLPWGIPLPFAPDYVTYVWFDALQNYISAIGYDPEGPSDRFNELWPANLHIVGKDILTTHSVYWSTMLFAMGLPPAKTLFAHGWWTVEGQKMSKSIGNVVDPHLLIDVYGEDPLRYFLLKEFPFGGDGDFSHTAFMGRFNADLANDLGNLLHRSLSMTGKWLGGKIPELDAPTERDHALAAMADSVYTNFSKQIESLAFSHAFETLWGLVRAGNKYLDSEEPWKLNREGKTIRLAGVMRRSLEVCRIAAVLMAPIMPTKCQELISKLGLSSIDLSAPNTLDGLVPDTPVEAGDPLFPRMQELPQIIQDSLRENIVEKNKTPKKKQKSKKPRKPEVPIGPIAIEDFKKVQLCTGTIVDAQPHPKADRLLVVTVDIGEDAPRTIVAGIADLHDVADLPGKQVIVVSNLKPAKLRGVISEGMILAAGDAAPLSLIAPLETVPVGTVVR